MGMYTELSIAVNLNLNTPQTVIDAVRAMSEGHEGFVPDPSIAAHPLFDTDRWSWMLISGGSAYFDGPTCCKFVRPYGHEGWKLLVHTNIKNYSKEWQRFLDFLGPYIEVNSEERAFIGHFRYEEDDEPTLLYVLPDGSVLWQGEDSYE